MPRTSHTQESLLQMLRTPTRNRYFYGKLLDVHHLELEQDYLNSKRWMLNRLGLGSGIACGLRVVPNKDGTAICVEPGVAIDGLGREIVVTRTHEIRDPLRLRDPHGEPADDALDAVTVCLEYLECEGEPTSAMVSACDDREACEYSVTHERYRIVIREKNLRKPVDCDELFDRLKEPRSCDIAGDCVVLAVITRAARGAGEARQPDARVRYDNRIIEEEALEARLASLDEPTVVSARRPLTLDERRDIELIDTQPAEGARLVPTPFTLHFETRKQIISNVMLLDLILCLAERIDECCGKDEVEDRDDDESADPGDLVTPPTTRLPRITGMNPPHRSIRSSADFTRWKVNKEFTLSFSTPMDPEHLQDTGNWMRVWQISTTYSGNTQVFHRISRAPVKYIPTTQSLRRGLSTYTFRLPNNLASYDVKGLVQYLIYIHSDPDRPNITSAANPVSGGLDAEFRGVSINDVTGSSPMINALMGMGLNEEIEDRSSQIILEDMDPPSGNGQRGGEFVALFGFNLIDTSGPHLVGPHD